MIFVAVFWIVLSLPRWKRRNARIRESNAKIRAAKVEIKASREQAAANRSKLEEFRKTHPPTPAFAYRANPERDAKDAEALAWLQANDPAYQR